MRAVPAKSNTSPSRVKRSAVVAFRFVRFVQKTARSVPGVLQTAAHDVADAWRETARPNA